MDERTSLTVVLAAGEGTRMRSSRPKVLHTMAGRPLIGHVLAAVGQAGGRVAVVIGPGREDVAAAVRRQVPGAEVFVQAERRGTAHAVLAAGDALARPADDILVVFADTPLITTATLERLRGAVAAGAAVAVLGFRPVDPTGYGRLVVENGEFRAIREEKDASPAERMLTLCNAGVMAFDGRRAMAILERIGDRNAKSEFYLTDAVEIARAMGSSVVAIETEEDEVRGINTQAQLAEAEAVLQRRLRQQWLDAGVTMVAPETVFLCADTRLAPDVVIEPYVVFGEGVVVEEGAVIRSFSHIEGAHIGKGARVGPFARLRPGADLGEDVHIGNFVEVKAVVIEAGAKANHLAYLGDGRVGEGANIGAGTIFCNYDGVAKHQTEIGKGAFIGSNSSLVAPVTVGAGAYVATGSVITHEVPADALAIARGRQVVKENRASRLLQMKSAGKKKPAHAAD
ncbi:MAG: bifunctional UDP-N-acetylglucosamine diphosphorylase/glucosamine-1-phosphate N-acetyltransferase GlmU [Xanthobacteraceae bacterium]